MRQRRGIGVTISVKKETPIVKKFQVSLKNSDNKTELFKMLTINITKIPANIVEIMAIHLEEVLLNKLGCCLICTPTLQPQRSRHALTFACSWHVDLNGC